MLFVSSNGNVSHSRVARARLRTGSEFRVEVEGGRRWADGNLTGLPAIPRAADFRTAGLAIAAWKFRISEKYGLP